MLRPPIAAAGVCLVLAAAESGSRRSSQWTPRPASAAWEAPLDVSGAATVRPWGRRIAVAGTLAGDPIVTALERSGAPAWTVAPPLSGAVGAGAAGPLLVVRDAAGALAALGRDGGARWSRPAPAGSGASRAPAPAVARGTVVARAGDGLQALDARTGELVGAIAGLAPASGSSPTRRSRSPRSTRDGLATGWRLATHLSVV